MIERYVWDIYTDGSCNSKSRLGGCGVYMVNKTTGEEIFFREGYCNTTTPRMEMRAIVNALELLPKGNPIKARIVCDSEFVVKFMNHHISRCLNDGKNITTDYSNSDLWNEILLQLRNHPLAKVGIIWLKGGSHQKDEVSDDAVGNNIADGLANYKKFNDNERIRDL